MVKILMNAAYFAAEKHALQRRKGVAAEPYINHLLEVAALVASATTEPDVPAVIAALLHDCIEDAGVTEQEVAEQFGDEIAGVVAEVTDDKSLRKEERKRLQVANASKKSPRGALVKLADKISNLRAMLNSPPADWSYERRAQYFIWAKQVVDGLPSPNPILKAEFDTLHKRFDEIQQI
jgi:GTP diphosphokinase / guanosine-3',5'-bis(diphosphate) 3'-diphosphatase